MAQLGIGDLKRVCHEPKKCLVGNGFDPFREGVNIVVRFTVKSVRQLSLLQFLIPNF